MILPLQIAPYVFNLPDDSYIATKWLFAVLKIYNIIIHTRRQWLAAAGAIPCRIIAFRLINQPAVAVVNTHLAIGVGIKIFNSPQVVIAIKCYCTTITVKV